MPRPRAPYPAYRLHRPSGQAVVTIAGCDHYLGPHHSAESRAAYDRAVLEWVAAGRPSIPLQRRHDPSMAELCLLFWEHAEQRYQRDGKPTGELPPYRSVKQ
jgi:hypothetical protein